MPRYKIFLTSIDPKNDTKDIETIYIVDADSESEAISKAKDLLKKERPDIHPAKTWEWSFYETHEQ